MSGDSFGAALAVGNFRGAENSANGRPLHDLAVGVPGEALRSGEVRVIYGSADGLQSGGAQRWSLPDPMELGASTR